MVVNVIDCNTFVKTTYSVKNTLIGLLLLVFFYSCKDESNSSNNKVIIESVIGDWDVLEAKRNNRVAKSLSNSKFFITDSTFSCNFLNASEAFPYSFNGKTIKVLNPENTKYTVRFNTLDTLILKTEIKNLDFQFTSVKATNDE